MREAARSKALYSPHRDCTFFFLAGIGSEIVVASWGESLALQELRCDLWIAPTVARLRTMSEEGLRKGQFRLTDTHQVVKAATVSTSILY